MGQRVAYLLSTILLLPWAMPRAQAQKGPGLTQQAQRQAQYNTHLFKGQDLFEQGRFKQAIAELDKALGYLDKPGAKYFKALCLEQLGQPVQARRLLVAIADPKGIPPKILATLQKAIRRLTRKIERAAPVKLSVQVTNAKGARVLLDGKAVEQHPAELRPGIRLLEVTLQGYQPYREQLIVEPGQDVVRRLVLQAVLRVAVTLIPNVQDATVTIAGQPVRKWPARLKEGTYVVRVERKGYVPHEEKLTVAGSQPIQKRITLKALPVKVTLEVPGAGECQISVDDASVGPLFERAPGAYRLKVRRQGYQDHLQELTVRAGEPLAVKVRMTPLPTRRNWYLISSYIAGGVGVALMGAGIGLHVVARSERKSVSDTDQTQLEAKDAYDASQSKARAAYALYGLGSAAIVTGAVLLAIGLTRKDDKEATAVGVWLGPDGGSVSLTVQY